MATHCLHIGINDYTGTANDLAGCVPDERNNARLFNAKLRRRGTRRDAIDTCPFFGTADTQVILLDRQATRAAILRELKKLLKKLEADDWGIITYSGHGTYVRDASGDETDGYDEAIVCHGLDWVLDDELGGLVEGRPEPKSKVLFGTDACHSGTMNKTLGPRLLGPTDPNHRYRFLPPSYLKRTRHIAGRLRPPRKSYNVIHLAACLDQQFAADARFEGPEGAFNHYKNQALCSLRPGADYGDWCTALGKLLPNDEFDQMPVVNAYARCLEWKLPTLK